MIKLSGIPERDSSWDRLNAITARLAQKDSSLWGLAAQSEASIRLDWIDLPETSRELLPVLDALAAWSRELGHKRYILCGMGGSSLAPEVIAAHFKRELIILDSTDPEMISRVLEETLVDSCIIVASKSGSTIETSSQRAFFQNELIKNGLDPKNHLVIITDPESPLHRSATADGLKVVLANPKVGGRFSALSAFGLTPAALIGIDVSVILDDAYDAANSFAQPDSPVVAMGALLARNDFAFARFYDGDSPFPGLADWIEQLVAESTGKNGRGVLPIVLTEAPIVRDQTISFNSSDPLSVAGPLGAQFIFWEWVTALLCYLLEVDPFNQPNVAESKEWTGKILTGWDSRSEKPAFTSGNLEIFASSSGDSVGSYLRSAANGRYLALMAYLDRQSDAEVIKLRKILEDALRIPVTFGWGPRFLHSTGQFHKGGPLVGSFIQITGATQKRLEIPGAGYGFERLLLAQAFGDFEAIKSRAMPIIRVNLKDRKLGIAELIEHGRSL